MGEGYLRPEFYESVRMASRYALIGHIVGFLTILAIIIIIILALGLALGIGAIVAVSSEVVYGGVGAGGFEDVGALVAGSAAALLALLLVVLIVLGGLVVEFYMFLKAGRILREYSESGEGVEAEKLSLPSTIIYYSALAGIAGVITLIILVGILLLLLASIGLLIGFIILGLSLRDVEERFSTPGLLLAIGGILSLLGFIFGFLSLVGLVLIVIALYLLYTESGRLAEKASIAGSETVSSPS
ncbi:MAG: hypothetical protein F7B17_07670 [Desulfurococcales archaeon]|nr:hypothetical protein [Desulfurococcales archaeon]